MSKFHKSREAEQLALGFHMLGIALGLFGAVIAVASALCFDSLVTFAAMFKLAVLFRFLFGNWVIAILWIFYNLSQVAWHLIACRQHRAHLKTLNS